MTCLTTPPTVPPTSPMIGPTMAMSSLYISNGQPISGYRLSSRLTGDRMPIFPPSDSPIRARHRPHRRQPIGASESFRLPQMSTVSTTTTMGSLDRNPRHNSSSKPAATTISLASFPRLSTTLIPSRSSSHQKWRHGRNSSYSSSRYNSSNSSC